ncbi:hypothetical protein Lal_00037233 [Lupinus albus]|nr:hypothetical protein Lal_00037233 [Lupinus albus]
MTTLYSYFRSSASYRVRIALNIKGVAYETAAVHLLNQGGEQLLPAFTQLNPHALVPVLADQGKLLTQSMAMLEYLEERYPTPSLLPGDAFARAHIRELSLAIACEIHPLNNLRVLRYLKHTLAVEETQKTAWIQHWIKLGFTALEQQLAADTTRGHFCWTWRLTRRCAPSRPPAMRCPLSSRRIRRSSPTPPKPSARAAARHQQVAGHDEHGFVVLVVGGHAMVEETLLRFGLRSLDAQHFGFQSQHVAGTGRTRPAEFIEAGTDDAALDVQGIDQQAHGQRGSMPAAGGQSAEEGLLCCRFVEVEGLGVVLLGELLDLFGAHGERTRRAEHLAGLEVVEASYGHSITTVRKTKGRSGKSLRPFALMSACADLCSTQSGRLGQLRQLLRQGLQPVIGRRLLVGHDLEAVLQTFGFAGQRAAVAEDAVEHFLQLGHHARGPGEELADRVEILVAGRGQFGGVQRQRAILLEGDADLRQVHAAVIPQRTQHGAADLRHHVQHRGLGGQRRAFTGLTLGGGRSLLGQVGDGLGQVVVGGDETVGGRREPTGVVGNGEREVVRRGGDLGQVQRYARDRIADLVAGAGHGHAVDGQLGVLCLGQLPHAAAGEVRIVIAADQFDGIRAGGREDQMVLAAIIADAGSHARVGVVDGLHHVVQANGATAVQIGRGDGEGFAAHLQRQAAAGIGLVGRHAGGGDGAAGVEVEHGEIARAAHPQVVGRAAVLGGQDQVIVGAVADDGRIDARIAGVDGVAHTGQGIGLGLDQRGRAVAGLDGQHAIVERRARHDAGRADLDGLRQLGHANAVLAGGRLGGIARGLDLGHRAGHGGVIAQRRERIVGRHLDGVGGAAGIGFQDQMVAAAIGDDGGGHPGLGGIDRIAHARQGGIGLQRDEGGRVGADLDGNRVAGIEGGAAGVATGFELLRQDLGRIVAVGIGRERIGGQVGAGTRIGHGGLLGAEAGRRHGLERALVARQRILQ